MYGKARRLSVNEPGTDKVKNDSVVPAMIQDLTQYSEVGVNVECDVVVNVIVVHRGNKIKNVPRLRFSLITWYLNDIRAEAFEMAAYKTTRAINGKRCAGRFGNRALHLKLPFKGVISFSFVHPRVNTDGLVLSVTINVIPIALVNRPPRNRR